MYSIIKEWKEFNISLDILETWMRANMGDSFTGNQAGSSLELWFTEEPSEEIKTALDNYWDAIDEEHEVATEYVSSQSLIDAESRAREDAVTKAWDALSIEQKKLLSGAEVLLADRRQMLIDFPEGA